MRAIYVEMLKEKETFKLYNCKFYGVVEIWPHALSSGSRELVALFWREEYVMSEFLTLDHQTAAASTEYEDDNIILSSRRETWFL